MNMKRLLTLVAFIATVHASAQQVNPVPDYVFANRMSAGRNTVTDTAAYFSIGPRYGATRGMMPPMVVDTASFSGNKRNGLLIFSVQKNKFLYWDSVGVKWAEMAGTAGTALTSADTAALLSTRAWRQKGIDSLAAIRIGGSGTTNYIPKFTAASTIGNSQIFDNGTNIGIFNISPSYKIDISDVLRTTTNTYLATNSGKVGIGTVTPSQQLHVSATSGSVFALISSTTNQMYLGYDAVGANMTVQSNSSLVFNTGASFLERGRINTSGEFILNSSNTDAGDFKLQVTGNTYLGGSLSINTSGQTQTITTYYGANSNGSNFFAGGGGLSSIGAVGNGLLGSLNASFGVGSLLNLTQGYSNSAFGMNAQRDVTTGYHNATIGKDAGIRITTGYQNVGVGSLTLGVTTGNNNVAVGFSAGRVDTTTAFASTITQGVYIGSETKASLDGASNEIVIGYNASGNGSNTVTIGNSSITQNYFRGALNTSAPTGGSSKPWRLGEVATVSPTSPNRTIRVEIDGTVYYIHAKTTND